MSFLPSELRSAKLLVSVRGADEVGSALAGGAGLIDIKEPNAGALGKASDRTISAVAKEVAGRCPVSAAFGELSDWTGDSPSRIDPGISFVKIGLSGANQADWRTTLESFRMKIESQFSAKLVIAAYGDWRRAGAPRPQDVADFALHQKVPAFLIDTFQKDGSTLLDWMAIGELIEVCDWFRQAGISTVLAGSLGRKQIRQLISVRPNWFAVRGAACSGGREGTIDTELVRSLVAELTT